MSVRLLLLCCAICQFSGLQRFSSHNEFYLRVSRCRPAEFGVIAGIYFRLVGIFPIFR